ncbi:MAG: hypothetical protein QNJ22_00960 [Desulfosarcinaceae bacterium]|nr:hypothetical protein [Desulfosarcinaceae bacterium]
MVTAEALRMRISDIDAQIRAVEERLPAHSVKPPIMLELFALEEARERLLQQLRELGEDH